jgi:hypothetical protein
MTMINFRDIQAGLPDFSWYNVPKREKYTKKLPQNIPNGYELYQMVMNYSKWL